MTNTALVIVDVQVGLFENLESEIFRAEVLLENINKLIRKARTADIPIIFIQHNDPGLPYETPAWNIHESLEQAAGDTFVDKTHCDSFFKTNLQEVLEKKSIDRIFVCGLQTEYCVDTACRSAVGKNFKTLLVKDAHSTRDSKVLNAKQIIDHHNAVLDAAFVELVATNKVEF